MFTSLQQREAFHLVFLRHFCGRLKPHTYALKGGVNLRFFFGSVRYSEDMDLDVKDIEIFSLRDIVMEILASKILATTLRTFRIEHIIPPDLKAAKQTETTQRFKVHLITAASEDLFTKIEFSRRGLSQPIRTEVVSEAVLQPYKLPSLIATHYPAEVAIVQKLRALASRAEPQARDIFDLHLLSPHFQEARAALDAVPAGVLRKAHEHALDIDYAVFRDTVLNYLSEEDRAAYAHEEIWEEMQLQVGRLIEQVIS